MNIQSPSTWHTLVHWQILGCRAPPELQRRQRTSPSKHNRIIPIQFHLEYVLIHVTFFHHNFSSFLISFRSLSCNITPASLVQFGRHSNAVRMLFWFCYSWCSHTALCMLYGIYLVLVVVFLHFVVFVVYAIYAEHFFFCCAVIIVVAICAYIVHAIY